MIRIERGSEPPVLQANRASWTEEYAKLRAGEAGVPAVAETRYRHPEIKAAVIRDSHGKCVYCESRPTAVAPGDVEHVEPKSQRPDRVVDWENLVFSCPKCNTAKGGFYNPDQPLIDPYVVDPHTHLRFDGPMVIDTTTRGELTMIRLRLNRPELLQRRAERLEELRRLVRRWRQMDPGELKNELGRLLLEEADGDKEYAAATREFLTREGVVASVGH